MCLIVRDDKIISIGQTGFNGRPHAETNAINNSFQNLKGSKMYVTLEPCFHSSKNGSCADQILRSGIKEIVLPEHNRNVLEDVPKHVAKDLKFHFAKEIKNVLKVATRSCFKK